MLLRNRVCCAQDMTVQCHSMPQLNMHADLSVFTVFAASIPTGLSCDEDCVVRLELVM